MHPLWTPHSNGGVGNMNLSTFDRNSAMEWLTPEIKYTASQNEDRHNICGLWPKITKFSQNYLKFSPSYLETGVSFDPDF